MSTQTGTATNYNDLLNRLVAFLTGVGSAGTPTFTGTGNGTMTGVTCYPGTKTETITVKCTSAATPGAEVWSVTGSVSGALASATTGVAYTSAIIGFTINAGATNFAVNDQFTIATTQGAMSTAGNAWTKLADNSTPYTYSGDTVVYECYLKAPGLSGTESIYVQLQAFNNASGGYYNWRMVGATGYNSSQSWVAQPGISPQAYMPCWNNSIPYTFIANGQRVIVIAQVGTVYESCYLGKFLPYGTPSQYPYPLAIGGSAIANTTKYSDTTYNHQAFFDPLALYVCWVDSTWQAVQNTNGGGGAVSSFNVFPFRYVAGQPTWMTTNLDGSYPVFAARLEMTSPSTNVVGELDGVYFTPGVSQSSGSTITIGGSTYTVLQNIFRTGTNNFAAILEA